MLYRTVAMASLVVLSSVAGAADRAEPGGYASLYANGPYMQDARWYDAQSPLDWPAADVREVAFARARSIIAHYELMWARDRLGQFVRDRREDFEKSPAFSRLRQDEWDAWRAYQLEVARVMSKLARDPNYVSYREMTESIGREIVDVREGEEPGPTDNPEVMNLAYAKLSLARRPSAMRAAALAGDEAVARARQQLQEAAGRVSMARAEFESVLRRDSEGRELRDAITRARITNLAAAAYEQSVRLIRQKVVAYAVSLHRNDASPYYGYTSAPAVLADYGRYDGVGARDYGFRRRDGR